MGNLFDTAARTLRTAANSMVADYKGGHVLDDDDARCECTTPIAQLGLRLTHREPWPQLGERAGRAQFIDSLRALGTLAKHRNELEDPTSPVRRQLAGTGEAIQTT
jgi:hypothetical protein